MPLYRVRLGVFCLCAAVQRVSSDLQEKVSSCSYTQISHMSQLAGETFRDGFCGFFPCTKLTQTPDSDETCCTELKTETPSAITLDQADTPARCQTADLQERAGDGCPASGEAGGGGSGSFE